MHYRSSSVFSLGRWTSQFPTGLACPVVLRISAGRKVAFAYWTGTICGGLFNTLQLVSFLPFAAPTTPARWPVWAVPRSLATTSGMISVPLGTEMFQFPRFPSRGLCVHPPTRILSCDGPVGFPIRTSPDIAPAHGSPRLFAVFHVLLRRLTPRHPPYALCSFFHVMRRICTSTLAAWFSSNQARYAVGKVLTVGWGAAPVHRAGLVADPCPRPGGLDHGSMAKLSCCLLSLAGGLSTATGKTARHIAGLSENQPLRSVGIGLFSSGRGSRPQVLVYPAS